MGDYFLMTGINLMYKILFCERRSGVYIGQTGKCLHKRSFEHKIYDRKKSIQILKFNIQKIKFQTYIIQNILR